jgi:nucleoside-diphosphate-sugar epimerase
MSFYSGKRVLVTGGAGFLGSHLVERLVDEGANVRVVSRRKKPQYLPPMGVIEYARLDLSSFEHCLKATEGMDVVFHLAAEVGGIGYNVLHHGTMLTVNSILNLNMLEAARRQNVERYQVTSSTCVYPREATVPTPETEGFKGSPEPTVWGYGWSKRVAELQAYAYAEEHKMKIAIVRPANAYGPRDDFSVRTSHVIPGLIRRVFEGTSPLTVWGSGNQTRSFIYVEDVVRGMMEITSKYAIADPVNLGTDEEVTIKELVNMIMELSGKHIKIQFDPSLPEGQPRKFADISKAREKIGWKPQFNLKEGLKRTIDWYRRES